MRKKAHPYFQTFRFCGRVFSLSQAASELSLYRSPWLGVISQTVNLKRTVAAFPGTRLL